MHFLPDVEVRCPEGDAEGGCLIAEGPQFCPPPQTVILNERSE
jgi:hypothetical protein